MASKFSAATLDGDNFTAMDWYASEPAPEDSLYEKVKELYPDVQRYLIQINEETRIEKKPNVGPSTQYLLLFSDEDRSLLTIDEILALYLIDVAERCKKSSPVLEAS